MSSGTPSCVAAPSSVIEATPRRPLQRDPRLLLLPLALGLAVLLIGGSIRCGREPDPLMRYGMWGLASLLLVLTLAGVVALFVCTRHANRRRVRLDPAHQTIEFEYFFLHDGRFVTWRRTPHLSFALSEIRAHVLPSGLSIGTPRGNLQVADTLTNYVALANYLGKVCVSCGYDLQGSPSGVCPECGAGVAEHRERQPWWHWDSAMQPVALILAAILLGVALAVADNARWPGVQVAVRWATALGPPMLLGLGVLYRLLVDCAEGRRPRWPGVLARALLLGLALALLYVTARLI